MTRKNAEAGLMTTALFETIREIAAHSDQPIAQEFLRRAAEGSLTRDENSHTHFCVYFAAYCNAEVFIGHHKKSGLWLFNGGHIDRGELPGEALEREIGEEWGLKISVAEIGSPQLLTITEIDNPTRQTCTRHYDIWYFIALARDSAIFDAEKLAEEFYEARWMTLQQANTFVTDPATKKALAYLETLVPSEAS
jgi:8-oxo-dGTP pyrophosphatase MutT (NUDIX family)